MGRFVAIVALACAFSAVPATAQASAVHLKPGSTFDDQGGRVRTDELIFAASPGESNVVRIEQGSAGIIVSDAVPVTPGSGCSATGSPQTVVCHPTMLVGADIALGDGDDRLEEVPPVPIVADGGPGNDLIDASRGMESVLQGGEGNDDLRGGNGNSTIDGGPGADRMAGGRLLGGIVTYADRSAPVTASLDGVANDGEAGEGDNILSGVEEVIGGSGHDTLIGDSANNLLAGGPGNDRIFGGGGDDRVIGGAGADVLSGGPGADAVSGYADSLGGPPSKGADGPNVVAGGPGADSVNGGPKADVIDPGPGQDLVDGGGGADRVRTRDGSRDLITCSHSIGRAEVDDLDLARRCGTVTRAGAGFPQILVLGQSDIDPDGTIEVGIGCSQDQRGGCHGRLRLSRHGRLLATEPVTIGPGSARLFKPVVHLPRLFASPRCRTARIAVRLIATDTRGHLGSVTKRPRIGALGVDCPLGSLLIAGTGVW